MPETFKEWNGDDWQEHVARLLRARYNEPGMYQEIPSRDKGDLGLEGFSRDGICYQCYAPEPPFTVATLYEKQRAKITSDIAKFITNSARLLKMFGSMKIKRWLLVVPYFYSAKLIEHCNEKKTEVLVISLPYVDAAFVVGIITDGDFEIELRRLSSVGLYQHELPIELPTDNQVASFSNTNVALIDTISGKAAKLPKLATPSKVDEFTFNMVRHYLRGESAISSLRSRDPEQYEKFLRCKQSTEEAQVIQSMVKVGSSSTLTETFSEFKIQVQRNVSVSPHAADVMAWGSVADWLLRCPLDF